jgi:hypothetical protein
MTVMPTTQSIEEKFFARVFYLTYDRGCWLWIGQVNAAGRPVMKIGDRNQYASRISLAIHTGKFPGDMLALHRCDNPLCVRPEHLYWGTRKQNGEDMSNRGRVVWNNGVIGIRGESCHSSNLTEKDVREIRKLHSEEGMSYQRIADAYGVGHVQILRICHRTRWTHVE